MLILRHPTLYSVFFSCSLLFLCLVLDYNPNNNYNFERKDGDDVESLVIMMLIYGDYDENYGDTIDVEIYNGEDEDKGEEQHVFQWWGCDKPTTTIIAKTIERYQQIATTHVKQSTQFCIIRQSSQFWEHTEGCANFVGVRCCTTNGAYHELPLNHVHSRILYSC